MQFLALTTFLLAAKCMLKSNSGRGLESKLTHEKASTDLKFTKFPRMSVKLETYAPSSVDDFITALNYNASELAASGEKYLAVHEHFRDSIYNWTSLKRHLKYAMITTPDGYKEVFIVADVHRGGTANDFNVVMMPKEFADDVLSFSKTGCMPEITITPLYEYCPEDVSVKLWEWDHPKDISPGIPFIVVPENFAHDADAVFVKTREGGARRIPLMIAGERSNPNEFFVDLVTFGLLGADEGKLLKLVPVSERTLSLMERNSDFYIKGHLADSKE